MTLKRIVSGGQTGVDRAALDVAIALGIDHGGWCPKGRKAEDGPIAASYQLQEMESDKYHVRTQQNVIDADATLILHRGELTGGTRRTQQLATRLGEPCLSVNLASAAGLTAARSWLAENEVRVLNVAGPRESSSPGIYSEASEFLTQLLA